jgi:hypothetical protein
MLTIVVTDANITSKTPTRCFFTKAPVIISISNDRKIKINHKTLKMLI